MLASPPCRGAGLPPSRRLRSAGPLAGAAGLGLLLPLTAASPALADLRFCNRTQVPVSVAVGYRDQEGWISEGWWTLKPNQCDTPLSGPLAARYYYFFASDQSGSGDWLGKAFLCTQDQMFTIRGADRCTERGFERKGFVEIDTRDQKSWTVQLVPEGSEGGATTQ